MIPDINWKNFSFPAAAPAKTEKPKAEACPPEIEITEEAFVLPDLGKMVPAELWNEVAEKLAELEYESRNKEYTIHVLEEQIMKSRKQTYLAIIEVYDLFQSVLGSFRVRKNFSTEVKFRGEQKGRGTHPITSEGMKNLRIVEKRLKELLADAGIREIKAEVGADLNIEEHNVFRTVRRKDMNNGVVARVIKPGYRTEEIILRKPLVEVVKN